ncbi:MAG: hypothetical protein QGG19_03245 [Alphaproteobacteria bacterium]|jgi:hypothetical protein|nr:hypothetical protein [Rhodospirillaceae bacterium]MDP6020314.1 hypothetical protein [Alphaproteobacteria bacterium]MDP6256557.1 hypothetical protein [Alphaproteobacteria bacterium]MDP7055538.1 hypothetical protein [Alphaproteobacteria bacterium]MDP7229402.1 hypothetical protein [Alphaproteobacteria bacterium]|tara:strand:- start:2282 stop:2539 length:258 start_codon:yes stop_codon:yes gene_type:complete
MGSAASSGDQAANQSASGSGPQIQFGNVQGPVQTTIGLLAGDLADQLIAEARKTGELETQLDSVTDERDELIKTVALMQATAARI